MRNLTFDHLPLLHLLWVVLALTAFGVYAIWQRRRALRLFAGTPLLRRLTAPPRLGRPLLRLGLIVLTLVLLVAAIIGPRWGEREQSITRRNIDVIVLLDVSRSMLARDIAPNRLERAKLSLSDDLLPALGGDRIALITFAGVPSLKCPLTNDYGFFRLALDAVSTQSAPRGGTLIGDAIRRAREAFVAGPEMHRVILLITDGEDQESFPVEAAQAIWDDLQVPIVAVALGDERQGARIPTQDGEGPYLKYEGEVVWSRANFDELRKVARVSDLNAFVPVGTRNFDLGEIYRQTIVPAIKHKEVVESERVPLPSQYYWFAVAALAALVVETFMREGPRDASARSLLGRQREEAA